MPNSKIILFAVGLVAIAGIAYMALDGSVGPDDGVQGTIAPADSHQSNKTAYYEELNKSQDIGKIDVLGKIAVALDSNPGKAETLLRQQGWSQEDYEKMVERVRKDDDLNRLFQEAKRAAYQQ